MTRLSLWLDDLARGAEAAQAEETSYRADFARRVAALAETRAVAFRRANLIRAVADSVAAAEDEQAAVAHGLAVLRTRLGWSSDSEARAEILERFAPVCETSFAALSEPAEGEEQPDPAETLADFEAWYRNAKGSTFWILFENVMPETPVVDF